MVDIGGRGAPTSLSERTTLAALRLLEATNVSVFRWSKGRVGGSFLGAPVILLTTSRAKTGTRDTSPLLALEDDESWIVVASRRAKRDEPEWYSDLDAYEASQRPADGAASNAPVLVAPEVECEGDRRVAVRSEVLTGEARAYWWARMLEVFPRFGAPQTRASEREVPVVRLTPLGS